MGLYRCGRNSPTCPGFLPDPGGLRARCCLRDIEQLGMGELVIHYLEYALCVWVRYRTGVHVMRCIRGDPCRNGTYDPGCNSRLLVPGDIAPAPFEDTPAPHDDAPVHGERILRPLSMTPRLSRTCVLPGGCSLSCSFFWVRARWRSVSATVASSGVLLLPSRLHRFLVASVYPSRSDTPF